MSNDVLHFNVSPTLVIKCAREMILDKPVNDAVVFLCECYEGMTVDIARKILAGDATIDENMELIEEDNTEWKKLLENSYKEYYHLTGKKVFKIVSPSPTTQIDNKKLYLWKDAYNKGLINNEFIQNGYANYGRVNVDLIKLEPIFGDFNSDRCVLVEYSDTIIYDPILRIKDFITDYCDKVKIDINEYYKKTNYKLPTKIEFKTNVEPEKDCFYWLNKEGVLTLVLYAEHEKFCDDIGISIEEYEKNNIRIHKPDGMTRMVASTMQEKYTDKQIEVLNKMPWVSIDCNKI